MILNPILLAILGGLVPAIIWLGFWLQEDRLHPEPKRIIILAFIAGMIAVVVALPFEAFVNSYFPHTTIITFILFAAIEELLKYWGASWSGLQTDYDDEPMDPIIYLISTALGFAALENIFFLVQPIVENYAVKSVIDGNLHFVVITGNLRFIGANLLHILSSAVIGIALAFAFYKNPWVKRFYLLIGITIAIMLHALFNFSIINDEGHNLMIVFGLVWLSIIVLILILEKVKTIKNINMNSNG